MNRAQARKLFAAALADRLGPEERDAFEILLEEDASLSREFERYADESVGGESGLHNIHLWLEDAGRSARRAAVAVDPQAVRNVIETVRGRHRKGRLIRMFAAVGAVAAAAAIVAIIFFPAPGEEPPAPDQGDDAVTAFDWPEVETGAIEFLSGDGRYFKEVRKFEPVEGVKLEVTPESSLSEVQKGGAGKPPAVRLLSGEVRVTLEEGAKFGIRAGDCILQAEGPASYRVRVNARPHDGLTSVSPESNDMAKHKLLARFGSAGVVLALSVFSGTVDVIGQDGACDDTVEEGGERVIESGPDSKGRKPIRPEDAFAELDANGDGSLDESEFGDPGHTDFDDNQDGVISLDEFRLHFHPPGDVKPEDEFRRLDRNNDAFLDAEEVDQNMLDTFDDNDDGQIDLEEFRAHFKPPVGPTAEEEFGKLDRNGDGALDGQEIDQRMLEDFDDNQDGAIGLEEFKAHFRPAGHGSPMEEFRRLDANEDGQLTSDEIDQRMIDDWDRNNDGQLGPDEFAEARKPRTHEEFFKVLDKNDDGVLTSDEVDQRMLDAQDDNGDGQIDETEWAAHKPKPGEHPKGDKPKDGDRRNPKGGDRRQPRGNGD